MKKTCMLLAACMLIVLPTSGCRQAASVSLPPQSAPTEIILAFWNAQDELLGDRLQAYIEQKLNIRFKAVSVNYDNYMTVLQQMAAADNLPDVFANNVIGTTVYESWISQGKIRALPKDLSKYPNLEAYLDTPYNERFRRGDGSYYVIPRLTYSDEEMWALDRVLMVRKDWMRALGLDPPESWDDFVDLLQSFVEEDPDANGKADTGGLIATHMNTLEAIYLSIFPEMSNTERGWMYEKGKWIPVYASEKAGAALQKMQDLYRKGLLVKDFPYTSTKDAIEKFICGEAGAICAQYYMLAHYFTDVGMQDQIDDMIQIIRPWPAPDGNTYRFTTSLHWSESYFGAGVDDDKMQAILRLYDWLLSDEFSLISQYGLEGIDWQYSSNSGGKIELIGSDTRAPLTKYPSLDVFRSLVYWDQEKQYESTDANAIAVGRDAVRTAQQELVWFHENTLRVNYNFDIVFMATPAKNSMPYNSDVQDEMIKVIVGEEDALTAWPKVMERLYKTTTLRAAVDEVTKEAEFEGITP